MKFSLLGKMMSRYSITVLVVSFLLIALTAGYGFGVFGQLSGGNSAFQPKGAESTYVQQEVDRLFGDNQANILVLLKTKDGAPVTDQAKQQEIQRLQDEVAERAIGVQSYITTGQEDFVSKDMTQTFLAVADDDEAIVESLRKDLKSDTFTIKVGGAAAINHDVNEQVEKDLIQAETISFLILAPLLVLVFRSFVAALLPLLLGALGIIGAFILTRVITEFMGVSQYAINVITLLGLGLAIDYSLLMVSRFREELRKADVAQALIRTIETAGRTVFFSGLTVVLSLAGMLVFPVDFLRSMAAGGTAAVVASMFAALVVLPAVLYLLGHKVNALSFGSAKRDRQAQKQRATLEEKESIWHKTGSAVMRHNKVALVVTVGVLLVVGLPFTRIHFATPDYRSLPEGSEARLASEDLTSNFDAQGESLTVLYKTTEVRDATEVGKLYDYVQALSRTQGVTGVESIVSFEESLSKQQYQNIVSNPVENPQLQQLIDSRIAEDTTLLTVHYDGAADSAEAQELVERVRAISAPANASADVGGTAANLKDLLATLRTYLPYGLALIMVTIFVLLFLMLGSFVLPAMAIIMNVLALGAAFGSLVWIFQEGNLSGLLGVAHTGSIDATMPILIFAIAFGLSMDYTVFLYGRIKEQYEANGHKNDEALLAGLQKVGSIITSAAILLFVVVAAFAAGNIPLIQQVGLGIALTVLIDAFIIRMVLVPASMKLLGKWNWWAPAPLKRLHKRIGLSH